MKFTVTMKNPDALEDALVGIRDESKRDDCAAFAEEFMEYGEYLNVEFDTVKKTATVLKVKE